LPVFAMWSSLPVTMYSDKTAHWIQSRVQLDGLQCTSGDLPLLRLEESVLSPCEWRWIVKGKHTTLYVL